MSEEMERWRNNERYDGVLVYRGVDGWVILTADRGRSWDRCPCCARPLRDAPTARLVADFLLPTRGET